MRDKDKTKHEDSGWTPDTQGGEDALKNEERSLDIGESGQFAPGGYYNQQSVTQSKRKTLDDIVPPGRH